jgi:hypothetical protein
MATREEFIRAFEELAAFLTANPGAPVPAYEHSIQVSATGYYATEEEQIAFIRQAALGMGVEPEWNASGTHFEASLQFGPIRYFVVASTAAHQADYLEEWRLGKEAFSAAKAEREANTLDGEAVEAAELPADACCWESKQRGGPCDECAAEDALEEYVRAQPPQDEEYVPAPFVKATPAEVAEAYESSAQRRPTVGADGLHVRVAIGGPS